MPEGRAGQFVSRAEPPPSLDNEALVILVEHAEAGDETATETVARAFHHLVVRIAGQSAPRSAPGVRLEDDDALLSSDRRFSQLVDWGNAGLRTAITQFDASMETRFSAYAAERIRRAIAGGASGAAGLGDGDGHRGPGGAGDRFPRRPLPSSGAGSVTLRAGQAVPAAEPLDQVVR